MLCIKNSWTAAAWIDTYRDEVTDPDPTLGLNRPGSLTLYVDKVAISGNKALVIFCTQYFILKTVFKNKNIWDSFLL